MDDTELELYIRAIVAQAQAESDAAGVAQEARYADARRAREACLAGGGTTMAAEACYRRVLDLHIQVKIALSQAEYHEAKLKQEEADRILYSKGLNS